MYILGIELDLKDIIEVIIALVIGYSSYRSAKISKRIEEGIKKINELQVYNKQRKSTAKILEEVKIHIEDISIDITNITYFSKIQSAISKIELHNVLLTVEEINNINKAKAIIRLDEIDKNNRKQLLEYINYFISKLLKGDILI